MPVPRGLDVRRPAVAGLFYPEDAAQLAGTVDRLLAGVRARNSDPRPKAVIAPHAGFAYSGPVAAAAYARLRPLRASIPIRRVVLLGPAHRVPFEGMALPGANAYRTPLGDVPVDGAAVALIQGLPDVKLLPEAHAAEHSIEVHVPFLQRILSDFTLVPVVVGDAASEAVAAVIEALWGGPETIIVVSSDLSHYQPYRDARAQDTRTAEAIERFDAHALGPEDACGCIAIAGLLKAARAHQLECARLDLRNSEDTAGSGGMSARGVVGYGAWVFVLPTA